jgi:hypothetical protein
VTGRKAQDVVHDWLARSRSTTSSTTRACAGARVTSATGSRPSRRASTGTAGGVLTPGAPPNGADFVRLRDGAGTYLRADQSARCPSAASASSIPTRSSGRSSTGRSRPTSPTTCATAPSRAR